MHMITNVNRVQRYPIQDIRIFFKKKLRNLPYENVRINIQSMKNISNLMVPITKDEWTAQFTQKRGLSSLWPLGGKEKEMPEIEYCFCLRDVFLNHCSWWDSFTWLFSSINITYLTYFIFDQLHGKSKWLIPASGVKFDGTINVFL